MPGAAEEDADGVGEGGPDAGPAADGAGAVSSSGALTRRASTAAAFTATGSSVLTTTTGAELNSCRARLAAISSGDEPVSTTVAEDGACVWATRGRDVPGCGCADEARVVDGTLEQAEAPSATTNNTVRNVAPRCLSMRLSR